MRYGNVLRSLRIVALAAVMLACKEEKPPRILESITMPTSVTAPIQGVTPEGMRGDWIYSGKILDLSKFRESEIPQDLKRINAWANVRANPLPIDTWGNVTLRERYKLVFSQYEATPAFQSAVMRISADSLSLPLWMTADPRNPTTHTPIGRVNLAKDNALEFYVGPGVLMLIKWQDSILLSSHFAQEQAYTHDVWVRRSP